MQDATNIAIETVGRFLESSESTPVRVPTIRSACASTHCPLSHSSSGSSFAFSVKRTTTSIRASSRSTLHPDRLHRTQRPVISATSTFLHHGGGIQCSESVAGFMNQCGRGQILRTVVVRTKIQRALTEAVGCVVSFWTVPSCPSPTHSQRPKQRRGRSFGGRTTGGGCGGPSTAKARQLQSRS